jgi:type II secretory ATPase GspE/PulE/Tfp pilus assembly ATPase PilB-like protein
MEDNDLHRLIQTLIERSIIPHDHVTLLHTEITRTTNFSTYLQKVYSINPWILASIKAEQHNYQYYRWNLEDIDMSIAGIIPIVRLKQFYCLPIQQKNDTLIVIFSRSDSLEMRSLLREYFPEHTKHELYIVPEEFLEQAWGKIPKDPSAIFKHLNGLNRWVDGTAAVDDISTDAVLQIILNEAYEKRASDIHFEPADDSINIRLRIDGFLKKDRHFAGRYWGYLLGRIKVLSGMNTAETRRPQSGRFTQSLNGHEVDIRAASHPTTKGESIVLRLLDKHKMVVPLEQLGFCSTSMKLLNKIYSIPQGLVLFTGPTGSGKTTTLYSILNQLNQGDTNIMTLEDPVEYDLPGIRQTSIQEQVLNFKEGIRAILRQDPDVILIGEIRDEDTAKMAFRASQTGHLVFSTLHTNDVWGVFPRLMDLGISFESIKHTVVGIVSQRLVRKRCPCFPKGCMQCESTGLYGRAAIGEILWITSELRPYLNNHEISNIPAELLNKHYISLRKAGIEAVNSHITTLHEIKRYCGDIE